MASNIVSYVIKAGDTIFNIADRHNVTWWNLSAYNNIYNPNNLQIGKTIKIPPSTYSG